MKILECQRTFFLKIYPGDFVFLSSFEFLHLYFKVLHVRRIFKGEFEVSILVIGPTLWYFQMFEYYTSQTSYCGHYDSKDIHDLK